MLEGPHLPQIPPEIGKNGAVLWLCDPAPQPCQLDCQPSYPKKPMQTKRPAKAKVFSYRAFQMFGNSVAGGNPRVDWSVNGGWVSCEHASHMAEVCIVFSNCLVLQHVMLFVEGNVQRLWHLVHHESRALNDDIPPRANHVKHRIT